MEKRSSSEFRAEKFLHLIRFNQNPTLRKSSYEIVINIFLWKTIHFNSGLKNPYILLSLIENLL